jgi:hypothetical protein
MATVGYFEGTDPIILTRLAVKGIGTLPLSNGFDMHGKYVGHVLRQDNISIVFGYLHKVLPTSVTKVSPHDLLYNCLTNGIPVALVVEKEFHEAAREQLGEIRDSVKLVDPANLYEVILKATS